MPRQKHKIHVSRRRAPKYVPAWKATMHRDLSRAVADQPSLQLMSSSSREVRVQYDIVVQRIKSHQQTIKLYRDPYSEPLIYTVPRLQGHLPGESSFPITPPPNKRFKDRLYANFPDKVKIRFVFHRSDLPDKLVCFPLDKFKETKVGVHPAFELSVLELRAVAEKNLTPENSCQKGKPCWS